MYVLFLSLGFICFIWFVLKICFAKPAVPIDARSEAHERMPSKIGEKEAEDRIIRALNLAMKPFTLKVNAKPKTVSQIEIKDISNSLTYKVLLHEQTCTCEEFQTRIHIPANDIRRWCKHIMQGMHSDDALVHENEWIRAIVKDGYHAPIAARMFERPTTGLFLLTVGKNPDWMNIYARTRKGKELVTNANGEITRFGWNMKDKYWAWGIAPPGARELKKLIYAIGWFNVN